MSHLKGERWILQDGRMVMVTADLANNFIRILNDAGKLEVIGESYLKERIEKEKPDAN